jgi:peptidoglycan/LPS O-acetylase OafA/YrhL
MTSPTDGARIGPGAPAGHFRQLDGLRALAVGAVFVEHWMPRGWLLHNALPWGSLGVKLFFVLSGFLITGILLDSRRGAGENAANRLYTLRQFWVRRFLRIFPAFYAVAIGAALCGVATARASLPWNLTYTSNFYLAAAGDWCGEVSHFWSLAVEEQFYLVWPWIILFLPLPAIRRLLAVMLIAAPAFRLWAAARGMNAVALTVLPPACLDTLGAGALLAFTRRGLGPAWFARLLRPPFPALAAAAVALLGAVRLFDYLRPLGLAPLAGPLYSAGLDAALGIAFAALVARAAEGFPAGAGALLGARPLVYLGTISYGLYLLHNFVPGLLSQAPLPTWLRPLIYPFATAALAAASWRLFEEPINRAKRHFPYARRTAAPAAPLQPRFAGEVPS